MTTLADAMLGIEAMFNAPVGKRRPIYLVGGPGIGKTAAPEAVAVKLGVDVIILQATNEDPITLSGLPVKDTDGQHAVFLMFKDKLPISGRGILVIDELPSAPPAVQLGFNGLLLNGRLGSYTLPDGWYVCATGNRLSDRAAVNKVPTPVQNRIITLEIESDLAGWKVWAAGAGIDNRLVDFLNWRTVEPAPGITDMLSNFDPMRPGPFASPRSWHMASDTLDLNLPPHIESDMLHGCLGHGVAVELVAFLAICRNLIPASVILADPENAPVPTEMSVQFAVCGSLSKRSTVDNFDKVTAYLSRLQPEIGVSAVERAVERDRTLKNTAAYIAWEAAHGWMKQ
jgi:hypothetical protein